VELSRLANRKYICTGINMYTAVDNGRKLDKTHWSSGIETWCNSKMQMLLKQDVPSRCKGYEKLHHMLWNPIYI